MIDAGALEEITKDHKVLARQQLQVLARYLKMDLDNGERKFLKEKDTVAELQAQLDYLNAELGEFFVNGVATSFSRKRPEPSILPGTGLNNLYYHYTLR